jgi:hypothetical protein
MPTPNENQSENTQNVNTQQLQSNTNAKNTTTPPPSVDKNAQSGFNDWLNKGSQLLIQGGQIVGAVTQQRQSSGIAQQRQAIKNACGRRPLIGRKRKEEYRQCAERVVGGSATPYVQVDENKTLSEGSSTSPLIIGVGVLALGIVGFLIYKKYKK